MWLAAKAKTFFSLSRVNSLGLKWLLSFYALIQNTENMLNMTVPIQSTLCKAGESSLITDRELDWTSGLFSSLHFITPLHEVMLSISP